MNIGFCCLQSYTYITQSFTSFYKLPFFGIVKLAFAITFVKNADSFSKFVKALKRLNKKYWPEKLSN